MPFILLLCILVSFLIACWGSDRKFGFWGYFFASLLLTPVIGALLVIASGKNPDADKAK
ncbi:MAG: hypothetical protein LBM74_07130 [Oscillospiraceae bacterium]|jgi:uncharacterized membrane protein YiaA|nr:hypothetical protein [Oscillospiraceae bacterium]